MGHNLLDGLARITSGKTGRCSSWDTSGRNADAWTLEPGETRVGLVEALPDRRLFGSSNHKTPTKGIPFMGTEPRRTSVYGWA